MAARFSTYEPPQGLFNREDRTSTILHDIGSLNREDELFVTKLLSEFVNKQSSLFQRWTNIRITECGDFLTIIPSKQLLILTPLRIIILPTTQSLKRLKQFRIIDINYFIIC